MEVPFRCQSERIIATEDCPGRILNSDRWRRHFSAISTLRWMDGLKRVLVDPDHRPRPTIKLRNIPLRTLCDYYYYQTTKGEMIRAAYPHSNRVLSKLQTISCSPRSPSYYHLILPPCPSSSSSAILKLRHAGDFALFPSVPNPQVVPFLLQLGESSRDKPEHTRGPSYTFAGEDCEYLLEKWRKGKGARRPGQRGL